MGKGKRRRKRDCHEREPLRIRDVLSFENRKTQDSDYQRVVQVYRIGKPGDPFEGLVVEQFSDFLRVRDGEESDSE